MITTSAKSATEVPKNTIVALKDYLKVPEKWQKENCHQAVLYIDRLELLGSKSARRDNPAI